MRGVPLALLMGVCPLLFPGIKLMDIEKTMQFILDTQSRLEATASQHGEHLAKLETLALLTTEN